MATRIEKIAPPSWGVPFPLRDDATAPELITAPLPERVDIPWLQHVGAESLPLVTTGDKVLTGQPIGAIRDQALGARVHAPLSGRVTDISVGPVPGRRNALRIRIESDGRDQRWAGYNTNKQPLSLSTSALRQAIIEGGIVGLGGAAFPAGTKLNRGSGVDTLILNAAECEPGISCDDALLRHDAHKVLLGAQVMLRVLEAGQCIIAIKDGMHAALNAVESALEKLSDERFSIALVPSIYPVGGEAQLIQLLTGRELPSGGLPWDSGAICQNVGTAAAVANFLSAGEPLISRIVTVTGSALADSINVITRIGTPIAELIALAGGCPGDSYRLIMGGPMMGVELADASLPVIKATNCLTLATRPRNQPKPPAMPCIRCGDCAQVCPTQLMPQLLLLASQVNDFDKLQQLGLADCIECGCCDYVCPSRLPLTDGFVAAKQQLWAINAEQRRATKAGKRYAEKQERLQRADAEQQQDLQQQTPDLTTADAQSKLAALLERTNTPKNSSDDKAP